MPRGPPPERLSRRGPPSPPYISDAPRGRSMRSPNRRRMDPEPEFDRRDMIEHHRRERMSPPRRRSRSPMHKSSERVRPFSPPMRRSPSPKHERKPYIPSSSQASRFGSATLDRSTFRGPEADNSYDPRELKKIRVVIERRLTSVRDSVPMNQMERDDLRLDHHPDRNEYRESPKMKRHEESYRPSLKESHREKGMPSWENSSLHHRMKPMSGGVSNSGHLRSDPSMMDGDVPYDMPPRDQYESPPRKALYGSNEKKHDDRGLGRNYGRKPPKDDFGPKDDRFPHRMSSPDLRSELDRRQSPSYSKHRGENLKPERLDSRQRYPSKRAPPSKSKLESVYPMNERDRRGVSPSFIDSRRSPDRYRRNMRGPFMSPPRRSGPPPPPSMDKICNMDRRRAGPLREERYRSPMPNMSPPPSKRRDLSHARSPIPNVPPTPPKRSRDLSGNSSDLMPSRRGRGGRGLGSGFRGAQSVAGSPPLRRFPHSRGGFSGQSQRRPFMHRKP